MDIIAIIISIVSMIVAVYGLKVTVTHFQKQLQLNFFSDYTKRYQSIILNFPESINSRDFKLEELDSVIRDKTLRYMRAYFDLCSEEYYLWKEKNIDDKTWGEWEKGIKFAFTKPAFIQAWEILSVDTVYHGEFKDFVRCSVKNNLSVTEI